MKDEKYDIEFTRGGVGVTETILTGGLAPIAEKVIDTITGDNDHGWYCTITDRETEVSATQWGATKAKAQEACFSTLKEKVDDFIEEDKRQRAEEEEMRREELELERQRSIELERESEQQKKKDNPSDFDGYLVLAKIIGALVIVAVVVWFVFAVFIPLVILNCALIALVTGLIKKQWRKWLLPVSAVGAVYVVIDYNNSWLSGFLPGQVHFFIYAIPFFYYVNVAAGLVALYFVVRNFLNAKYPDETQAHEFSKRNLIVAGSLLLIGGATFGIQKYVGHESDADVVSSADSTTGHSTASNDTGEIKLMDQVIASDDPAEYAGEWEGHWIDYEIRTDSLTGAQTSVETVNPGVAFEFSISFDENSKCQVVIKNIESTQSSTLRGTIKEGKIQAEGNEADFYKYQLPTVSLLPEDELLYQDGGGDIKLKRRRN
jgi:hypothetical protein